MTNTFMPELAAIQAIAEATSRLSRDERLRVSAWFAQYAMQEAVDIQPQEASVRPAEPATEEPEVETHAEPQSLANLLAAVAPRTGAQKVAVAGYWLERGLGREAWKASEVNRLLKAENVRLSSVSIVLTNAVKTAEPLMVELGRSGDGTRSRKFFRLSDAGVRFVEERL